MHRSENVKNKNRFRTKFYAKIGNEIVVLHNQSMYMKGKKQTFFLLNYALSFIIDFVKCKRTCIISCQACFFLLMSINDSRCLPIRIIPERICSSSSFYIFLCMCNSASACLRITNMEVSMSFVLK